MSTGGEKSISAGRRANGIGWKWSDVSSEQEIVNRLVADAWAAGPVDGMPLITGLTETRLRRLLKEAVDAALQLQANRAASDLQAKKAASDASFRQRYLTPLFRRWRFIVASIGLSYALGALFESENVFWGVLLGSATMFVASHGWSAPESVSKMISRGGRDE